MLLRLDFYMMMASVASAGWIGSEISHPEAGVANNETKPKAHIFFFFHTPGDSQERWHVDSAIVPILQGEPRRSPDGKDAANLAKRYKYGE